MTEVLKLFLSFLIGGVLGTAFFAGLWWTVQRIVKPGASALLLTSSLLLRMGGSLAGFYAVIVYFPGKSGLVYLIVTLLGFFTARFCVHQIVQRRASCN